MKQILSIFITAILLLAGCSSTRKIKTESGISRIQKIELGGVDQWTLIRSENRSNPIILFLHGGPGASETAWFRHFNSALEKDFTLVFWDQRGTAKSYSKSISKESMTLEQLKKDANELIDHIRKEFKQDKIILLGHSWGSVLGIELVKTYPEKFYCYVGVGQVINSAMGEVISYNYTLKRAIENSDQKAVADLEKVGVPVNGKVNPWDMGRQRKLLLKYGGERCDRDNYRDYAMIFLKSKEYTFIDAFRFIKGSGFSWKLREDEENIDFFTQAPKLEIPVLLCIGNSDFNTPSELVERYFLQLDAPWKKLVRFEKSGHMVPFEEPDKFNKTMKDEVLPITKKSNQL